MGFEDLDCDPLAREIACGCETARTGTDHDD
jgi:hypothetical protein